MQQTARARAKRLFAQHLLSSMLEKPDFGVLVTNIPSTGVKQALGH